MMGWDWGVMEQGVCNQGGDGTGSALRLGLSAQASKEGIIRWFGVLRKVLISRQVSSKNIERPEWIPVEIQLRATILMKSEPVLS